MQTEASPVLMSNKYVKKSALSLKRNKLAAILTKQIGTLQISQDNELNLISQQQPQHMQPSMNDARTNAQLERVL